MLSLNLIGHRIYLFLKLLKYVRTSFNKKIFWKEFFYLTSNSFFVVIMSGIFVGAIMGLQMYMVLQRYEANSVLGGLATSLSFRNLGPVLIAFILSGKIGALITAELANMKVTEQIESLESLDVDLYYHLYTPRFLSIVLGSFVLLVVGLIVTLLGTLLTSLFLGAQNELSFVESMIKYLSMFSVFTAIVKCFVFASLIAITSIDNGINPPPGAQGVGEAVTRCATENMFMITIMNFLISFILEVF